jgi:hypothetical protein
MMMAIGANARRAADAKMSKSAIVGGSGQLD